MFTFQTLTLEEIENKPLKELLNSVLKKNQAVTVQLPDGGQVIIQPKPQLKPLPALEGDIPNGWKDAIYDDRE